MPERERLPDRRAAEFVEFEHGGRHWTATIGRFKDGRLAEVFLHAGKDSPLLNLAQDAAIIASIALQFGAPANVVAHALAGRDAGPLAQALAMAEGLP
jgi:hypothetical protein